MQLTENRNPGVGQFYRLEPPKNGVESIEYYNNIFPENAKNQPK